MVRLSARACLVNFLSRRVFLALAICLVPALGAIGSAAPITGGTGPGGVGTTDGASNLQLWYRAEDLQQSGGNVSSWLDSSGNGYTASPGTGSGESGPTYAGSGMNSLPTARFTGASTDGQLLEVSSAGNGILQDVPGVTMFAAVDHSQASISGNQNYFAAGTGDGSGSFRSSIRTLGTSATTTARRLDADTATHVSATSNIVTPMIATGLIDYTLRDGYRYTNGTLLNSNLNILTSAGNTENTASDRIVVGNLLIFTSTYQQMVGDISEMIVFNRALNSAERILVDNYLSSKFNAGTIISGSDRGLTTDDHYAGDTTTNGNYDYDVFGIGRVNSSNQVLSSGAAGFGIEVSSFPSDNTWVLAGRSDNTAINSLVTTDLGGTGMQQRWQRDWYVDVTGTFGATLAFDFTDADLSPGNLETYTFSLLSRSGLSGDYVVVPTLTQTRVGDTVLFTLASGILSSGYYTLGFVAVPEPSTACLLGLGLVVVAPLRRRRRASQTARGL